MHQTVAVQQRGPWSFKGRGSHYWDFRRSIAWLSDSLSTLRSADYSNPTQDSLPVAGQALLDGLSTRKIPLKGFRVANYISSPFPKLAWRKHIDRQTKLHAAFSGNRWAKRRALAAASLAKGKQRMGSTVSQPPTAA